MNPDPRKRRAESDWRPPEAIKAAWLMNALRATPNARVTQTQLEQRPKPQQHPINLVQRSHLQTGHHCCLKIMERSTYQCRLLEISSNLLEYKPHRSHPQLPSYPKSNSSLTQIAGYAKTSTGCYTLRASCPKTPGQDFTITPDLFLSNPFVVHHAALDETQTEITTETAENRARAKTPEEIESIDLTGSPDRASKLSHRPNQPKYAGLPTPPSSSTKATKLTDPVVLKLLAQEAKTDPKLEAVEQENALEITSSAEPSHDLSGPTTADKLLGAELPQPPPYFNRDRQTVSYKSLQDFYSLFDQMERTSYVGALFPEAYAVHLRDELCNNCWLARNVDFEGAREEV
ncbi:hypothetical protein P154DRAFT_572876 [Amniculicola lignicola CBS 123094]|uniref:Uncharacterized protein n=1 Tax=Amniculicola lignicola CBS 123094 TaxID=1392246 RepID=A0A6A5WRJ0_9PLEO|nr:hypothetical protein P154DRAFT_572876 [Amniculicola lignicola CBS 123094]